MHSHCLATWKKKKKNQSFQDMSYILLFPLQEFLGNQTNQKKTNKPKENAIYIERNDFGLVRMLLYIVV